MPEQLPPSKSTPAQTATDRTRMSLANRDLNMPADLQPMESDSPSPSPKTVDKIRTYLIWSIFNLLFVPLGILCCYFSHKVNQFKIQNRYEIAKKWSRRTFVINIMTTLVMFGVIVAVVMLHYDYVQRNPPLQANQTLTTAPFLPWQPGR
jgi:hypothetical protein